MSKDEKSKERTWYEWSSDVDNALSSITGAMGNVGIEDAEEIPAIDKAATPTSAVTKPLIDLEHKQVK